MESSEIPYPMRLNKYLAHRGFATRREADTLIEDGKVFVNGKRAVVGQKVEATDSVDVRRGKTLQKTYVYVAANKPRGLITHDPSGEEEDVLSLLPKELENAGLFPLGRLDKDSQGLILLTNDGRITERLLSPSAAHEKEYSVRTKLSLRQSFKEHMEAGVDIEGYTTKPARVKILGEKQFSIVITEGKKHQIRRMVVAMHNEVTELKRTRIMHIRLGSLGVGKVRVLEGKELQTLLSDLHLG